MEYKFDSVELGRCSLIRSTTGKHGFCSPKVFTVIAMRGGADYSRTYRHVDNLLVGYLPTHVPDNTLCRLAIAQFLIRHSVETWDNIQLDLTILPFPGIVLTSHGSQLRKAALIPPYVAQSGQANSNA